MHGGGNGGPHHAGNGPLRVDVLVATPGAPPSCFLATFLPLSCHFHATFLPLSCEHARFIPFSTCPSARSFFAPFSLSALCQPPLCPCGALSFLRIRHFVTVGSSKATAAAAANVRAQSPADVARRRRRHDEELTHSLPCTLQGAALTTSRTLPPSPPRWGAFPCSSLTKLIGCSTWASRRASAHDLKQRRLWLQPEIYLFFYCSFLPLWKVNASVISLQP